jgi:hypothetical protein
VVKGKQYIQRNLAPGTLLTLGQTQVRFVWEGYAQWRGDHAPEGGGEPQDAGPGEDGAPPVGR